MQRSQTELETICGLLQEKQMVVAAQITLHEKLIENAKLKLEAIQNRDIEKLEELTRWDQAVLEEVAKWEDRLEKVIKALATWYRVDIKDFNLSGLLALLNEEPEEVRAFVPELARENSILKEHVETLKELNEKNTFLLRRSLAVINFSLETILGKKPETGSYDEKGRRSKDTKKHSIIDRQV
ncbi:MAG TPA: flagellar protein FlgN [Bacillota bacterium]|jgi:flagellar biosynthesis/type III secretory pathway chaperone|nr:flagellar protein FlgN [Bacillota bacterium]HOJ45823.1 flagellar protein FlgN [Bacillota bacterium]